jgi:hypothetical protein
VQLLLSPPIWGDSLIDRTAVPKGKKKTYLALFGFKIPVSTATKNGKKHA